MKKTLLILLMTTCVGACIQQTSDRQIVFPEQPIVEEPSEQIVTQYGGLLEAEQIDLTAFEPQAPSGPFMDTLAQKLHQELRSTGIQVKQVDGQIDLIFPNKVVFGTSQKDLQPKFEEKLKSVAALLKEYEKTMIQIIGYTDNVGPVLVNQALSLQKADVIANYLETQGVASERIITDGAGPQDPVANNAIAAGREQNRRIEMTLINMQ